MSDEAFHLQVEWVYAPGDRGVEGVLAPLLNQLSREFPFDRVQFEFERAEEGEPGAERPWDRRCVLALRRGLYRVLKINLVREVGRTIVRLHVMRQRDVRRVLVICREHFDAWFQVTTAEIGGVGAVRGADEVGEVGGDGGGGADSGVGGVVGISEVGPDGGVGEVGGISEVGGVGKVGGPSGAGGTGPNGAESR